MSRSPIDHDHKSATSRRAARYLRMERLVTGDAVHPKLHPLDRRRRSSPEPVRLRQFLRIERGYRA